VWIVVSRPRTDNEAKDWENAAFFGPFSNETAAKTFARERDMGKENERHSFAIEPVAVEP
jgi:hypothetical protein